MNRPFSQSLVSDLRSKLLEPLKVLPTDDLKMLGRVISPRGVNVDELLSIESDEEFVSRSIAALFDRPATPSCIAHHVEVIRSKTLTRQQLLASLEVSEEGLLAPNKFVNLTWRLCRERANHHRKNLWRRLKSFWKGLRQLATISDTCEEYSRVMEQKAIQSDQKQSIANEEFFNFLMHLESRINELEKRLEGINVQDGFSNKTYADRPSDFSSISKA